eukprot:CAMPEP_0169392338 /NCGR_PEP_ID=MMETSP1017-20121227/48647_1 /TAXON_ID=342587 /ORGANISM="Karlodinium micrum, Strain CCMP2283" /LENGTH=183 /DNA_ID=CAMNT_0009495435 /DNA_START=23 /DNA_END=571 /DNA_ORIENTATION=+
MTASMREFLSGQGLGSPSMLGRSIGATPSKRSNVEADRGTFGSRRTSPGPLGMTSFEAERVAEDDDELKWFESVKANLEHFGDVEVLFDSNAKAIVLAAWSRWQRHMGSGLVNATTSSTSSVCCNGGRKALAQSAAHPLLLTLTVRGAPTLSSCISSWLGYYFKAKERKCFKSFRHFKTSWCP